MPKSRWAIEGVGEGEAGREIRRGLSSGTKRTKLFKEEEVTDQQK